jgi:hypothetical protein
MSPDRRATHCEDAGVASEHQATVYENRGTDLYDPYLIEAGKFLVGCVCGWYSGQVESRDEAFAAARAHATDVKTEVESLFPDR